MAQRNAQVRKAALIFVKITIIFTLIIPSMCTSLQIHFMVSVIYDGAKMGLDFKALKEITTASLNLRY